MRFMTITIDHINKDSAQVHVTFDTHTYSWIEKWDPYSNSVYDLIQYAEEKIKGER